jgi:DNA-binding NarL/FixJ family response regulator
MACDLCVSEPAVRKHVRALLVRYHSPNRVAMVIAALAHGDLQLSGTSITPALAPAKEQT